MNAPHELSATANGVSDPTAGSALATLVVTSGLALNPSWPEWVANAGPKGLLQLCSLLSVQIQLDDSAQRRLAEMWAALESAAVDEVSDWALNVTCKVLGPDDASKPVPIGVGATVYTTGELYLSVTFDGLDSALWLTNPVDLLPIVAAVQ